MTTEELAVFLINKGQAKQAVQVLRNLIPQQVAFNNVIFAALGGNHDAAEPATQELLALAQLTSDLYHLKNGLEEYLKDKN